MSGLCKCSDCGVYYSEPKEFDDAMEKGCDESSHYVAVIKCQCGKKRLAGGETTIIDTPPYDKAIMTFGQDMLESESEADLPVFDAVILTECEANDPDSTASTYTTSYVDNVRVGRTIHLKPKV